MMLLWDDEAAMDASSALTFEPLRSAVGERAEAFEYMSVSEYGGGGTSSLPGSMIGGCIVGCVAKG